MGAALLLALGCGLIGYRLGDAGDLEPVYLSPVTGEPVRLGEVPERGTASVWQPDAPTLRIPVLEVAAPLGTGIDGGPGPVVLTGTPWPGQAGRSVLLVNAELSALRTGDLVSVDTSGTVVSVWRITRTAQVGEGDLATVTAQPRAGAVELVLLEALPGDEDGRTIAYTWRVTQ